MPRRPSGSDFRANICVGGSVELLDLDDDRRIIAAVAPRSEPTGIRQLARLSGTRPTST